MVNITWLCELVIKQAKDKGFGTTPQEISVGEKTALIHSELSEAYAAFLENNYTGRDGVHEEMADALQRILHLGSIFGIDFTAPPHEAKNITGKNFETQLITLHRILSEAYEHYRHKKEAVFREKIALFAHTLLAIAVERQIPIEDAVYKKMEINANRNWSRNDLREKLNK